MGATGADSYLGTGFDCVEPAPTGEVDSFAISGGDTVTVSTTDATAGSQFVRLNDGFRSDFDWTTAPAGFQATNFASSADSAVPVWMQRGASGLSSVTYTFDNETSTVQLGVFDVDDGEIVTVTAADSSGGAVTVTKGSIDGDMTTTGGPASGPAWDPATQILTGGATATEQNFVTFTTASAIETIVVSQIGAANTDGVFSTVLQAGTYPEFPNCGVFATSSQSNSWGDYGFGATNGVTIDYTNAGTQSQLMTDTLAITDALSSRFISETPLAEDANSTIPGVRVYEGDKAVSTSTLTTFEFDSATSDFFLLVMDVDEGDSDLNPAKGDIVFLSAVDATETTIDLATHVTVEDACDITNGGPRTETALFDDTDGKIRSREADLGNRNVLVFSFDSDVKRLTVDFKHNNNNDGQDSIADHVYYALFESNSAYQSGPGCTDMTVEVTEPAEATPPAVLQGDNVVLSADMTGTNPAQPNGSDRVDRVKWFLKRISDDVVYDIATKIGTNLQNNEQSGTFDSEAYANGGYKIYAKARTAPDVGSVPARWVTSPLFDVQIDNSSSIQPLTITAPADSSTISGDFLLTVDTDPALNIQAVKWSFDGVDVATDNTLPGPTFDKLFDTTTLANGTYQMKARGKLPTGWSGGPSQTITVTISNTAPLTITAPADSSTISGDFLLAVDTDPALNAQAVKWSFDGVDVATDNTLPGPTFDKLFDTTTLANGTYQMKARGKLPTGWSGGPSQTITVTISN